jgi:phytoene desaturase
LDLFDYPLSYIEVARQTGVARKSDMSHHFPTETPKEIIVIGGGMGGMAVAARLAKKGHRVSLFEASNHLGGKCRTEEIDGFKFDTGPSLLTLPAVYRDLFIKTGKRLEHLVELKPVDPAFSYIFADGKRVTFPNLSHRGTVKEISDAFGSQAGEDWHAILSRAELMWESARETFIEGELRSIWPFIRRRTFFSDLKTIAPWRSLNSLVNKYTEDPYLRSIIWRYATYTGSDPRRVPAVLLTIAFVEEAFGAWHVSGGLGQLANKLAARLGELGVNIQLNSPVAAITTSNGRATGIRLADGREISAAIVISNSDAYELYGSLLPHSRKSARPRRSLRRATPSLSGFSLQLGLRGKSGLDHHTVFFPADYAAEFDAIFKDQIPPTDPSIYICNPADSQMLPNEDSESWFILINAPRHNPGAGFDWNAPGFSERYANSIIDKLEARGLEIRSRLVAMKIRTPADLEREVRAPGGSIYGTSSNGARSAFLRARNRSPIENLFCVGGSAHPGGGLPLVAISAEIVAAAIEGQRADGAH